MNFILFLFFFFFLTLGETEYNFSELMLNVY